ncbi:MAG: 2Fe-2S iron-sulfur cluster-binding protein [Paracoccaceae bacterium]
MARFHDLTVTEVRKTIRDAVVVTLVPHSPETFGFVPGQYLTFRRDFDGTEIRRSYSICTAPEEGLLQVGIKRVDGGAFSTWANTDLCPGDVVQAMAPMGQFYRPEASPPSSGHHHLGFAGGSGITPVLSILRRVLASDPNSRFTLVYANRAVHTIMFREELEDLKNRYMGRLNLIHILEHDAQDIELFTGRVDEAKCAALFKAWVDVSGVDRAYICGPEPMMLSIQSALRAHGMRDDQIAIELFSSGQPGRLDRPAGANTKDTPAQKVMARVTLDGATRTISIAPDQTVLQAALAQSLDAPYACTAGVCSTCKCKVTEGEVVMAANHALEDDEVARGYILSCQSFVVSDTLAVDYDQH